MPRSGASVAVACLCLAARLLDNDAALSTFRVEGSIVFAKGVRQVLHPNLNTFALTCMARVDGPCDLAGGRPDDRNRGFRPSGYDLLSVLYC